MNALISDAQKEEMRVTRLCTRAFHGPPTTENEAHMSVLALVPPGIYRNQKGEQYYIVGVEREYEKGHTQEYVVRGIPCSCKYDGLIRTWPLIKSSDGDSKPWFKRTGKGEGQISRFTLVKKITMAEMLRAALEQAP